MRSRAEEWIKEWVEWPSPAKLYVFPGSCKKAHPCVWAAGSQPEVFQLFLLTSNDNKLDVYCFPADNFRQAQAGRVATWTDHESASPRSVFALEGV